jgi:hypothetical protein
MHNKKPSHLLRLVIVLFELNQESSCGGAAVNNCNNFEQNGNLAARK